MATPEGPTFEAYVRLKSDKLIRLAWLVTRDWDEARDCVQDVLVAAYPRWESLATNDRLDAYVNRCVINASIGGAQRRRRAMPVADPQLLSQAPRGPDPATEVVGADAAWRLCADLPVRQRAAVVLRFYQDLSFAEIGKVLGCPEATARSHVHRALASLRAQLEKESSGE